MSYDIHYRTTAISKNSLTYILNIYEQDYVGYILTIDPVHSPFILRVNASSDDPYEPILASELQVSLDVTDTINDFIDFTTQNPYKYFATLSYDGNIVFQGWVITDNTNITFSTGRQTIAFSIIDGLSMLKTIPYNPVNQNKIGRAHV